jgi:hypothetical protein
MHTDDNRSLLSHISSNHIARGAISCAGAFFASGFLMHAFLAGVALNAAAAASRDAVAFLQVPEGTKLITVPLAVLESSGPRQQGYLVQRSQQAEEIAKLPPGISETYAGKEFFAFEIATLPDGMRYLAIFNEDKNLRFLNRNESTLWYARIYRMGPGGDAKPELVREGLQPSSGGDVTVPVELPLPGLGTTKLKVLRTELGYGFSGLNNGKPQVYKGRGAPLQVTGSHVTPEGKLTVAVTVPDELAVTSDTQVSLRFEPLKPGLPERTASGKVTDFLTLGSARFLVTALAQDFSSATLGIVAGSLEETLKQQLQLGSELPPFSQVELVSRKTVTREDLLARAKNGMAVLFIFADLGTGASRFGGPYGPPYGMPGNILLPLPPTEVAEQAGLELEPKPVVVLVTRQISIDFLYSDLRNKTPEYLILADFADPLRTVFRVPQNGPGSYYGGPPYGAVNEPSLRQLFHFPERTVALAAFDRMGKVVYVRADAGSEFLASLAEARAALKRSTGTRQ